jgi:hypothetical protein
MLIILEQSGTKRIILTTYATKFLRQTCFKQVLLRYHTGKATHPSTTNHEGALLQNFIQYILSETV